MAKPTYEELQREVDELERIRRMAFTDTAENFLKLSDEDKRIIFAAGIRESTRRKEAEIERDKLLEALEEAADAFEAASVYLLSHKYHALITKIKGDYYEK